jgi:VanZ family protein
MAFLFALSSISHPPEPSAFGVSDKVVHALLYVALGVLMARAIDGRPGGRVSARTLVAAVLWSAVYGVSDEIHQHFVPPRQMDALDLLADAIGAALGAGAYARARAHADAAARRQRGTPSGGAAG